MFYLLTRGKG